MRQLSTGFRLLGAFALLALALGCANTGQTENLLSTAGFRTVIATTPQQQQHLKRLPPDKVTVAQRNGKTYYVYADPAHNRIYVGNPAQYQRYQQLRRANIQAEEQVYSEAMGDWGVWEPFGY